MPLPKAGPALIGTLLSFGCASGPVLESQPPRILVPYEGRDGAGEYLVFREGAGDAFGGGKLVRSFPVPREAGRPLASGRNHASGRYVVVYERGLVAVEAGSRGEPQWFALDWDGTPQTVSVAGDLAAVVTDERILVVDLDSGKPVMRPAIDYWIDEPAMKTLHFASPDAFSPRGAIVVVGSGSDGSAPVISVSSQASAWKPVPTPLPRLERLHACTSDGDDVYLAGVSEAWHPDPKKKRETVKNLVVVRFDARTRRSEVVADSPHPDSGAVVRSIDVGSGVIVLSLERGEVLVGDTDPEQPLLAAVTELPQGVDAVYLGKHRVGYLAGEGVQAHALPR